MRLANPFRATLLIASYAFMASAPLTAQQATAGPPKPWENTVTIYGWAAAMSGTADVGPVSASVDVPFSDILSNLKMGAMLNYQGRSEKWVASFDFIYMKLGSNVAVPSTGTSVAEITMKQWLVEGDGGYRIRPWLDALVGLRIPVIEGEIDPDQNGPILSAKSKTESWVAPVIGARAELPFGKKFLGVVRADIGGFDIGGTNMTWQLAGYVSYRFSSVVSGGLGYRALSFDYATGSGLDIFKYDITSFGPAFGVSFSF
jgi:opacity protein-like surface antigen